MFNEIFSHTLTLHFSQHFYDLRQSLKPLSTNRIDFDKIIAQMLIPSRESVKGEARAVENMIKIIIQLWSALMCFKGGECMKCLKIYKWSAEYVEWYSAKIVTRDELQRRAFANNCTNSQQPSFRYNRCKDRRMHRDGSTQRYYKVEYRF